jgi:HSP20 family protein
VRKDEAMFGTDKAKSGPADKQERPAASPPLDVYENDTELLLIADVPGVPQGGAEVTLDKDRLLVEAKGATRRYRRELLVPPSIDGEKISASMKAGVLTVVLPKRAQYQPRQIQVRSA